VYEVANVQIHQAGSFRWETSDQECLVTPLAGSGTAVLPFTQDEDGDTDAFAVPAGDVAVQVADYKGDAQCALRLFDPANGQELDLATAKRGTDTVTLAPRGRSPVYLHDDGCAVKVWAQH
jgi:hypothetical protein